MSTSVHVEPPAPVSKPEQSAGSRPRWPKYVTPALVVLLALAILITLTRNWNSWEGGHVEQVTDDAYVRGDLTPLSMKVAGMQTRSAQCQQHSYLDWKPPVMICSQSLPLD